MKTTFISGYQYALALAEKEIDEAVEKELSNLQVDKRIEYEKNLIAYGMKWAKAVTKEVIEKLKSEKTL